MSEIAATIQMLAQSAAMLQNVTGADSEVKALLAKIKELTTRVKA